uniref:Uncharacterized protein n=1 Tax=viral metagenome TaxID=1070528 RepID=A0A6C0DR88_9ZZZZ
MLDPIEGLPVAIGAVFGIILAYLFKLHSKPDINEFTKTIFSISSQQFINLLIISMAATFFIVISTIAIIIKDTRFITENPGLFFGEICFASFVPSTILFVSTLVRGVGFTALTIEEYLLLVSKFGITHLLFQLSGYYSYVFPKRSGTQA